MFFHRNPAPEFLNEEFLNQETGCTTVRFHNFNLRIFNLRVSNPNKLIVDVFLTRCRISMWQGLGPKKHDEISEIDRMYLHALAHDLAPKDFVLPYIYIYTYQMYIYIYIYTHVYVYIYIYIYHICK